MRFVPAFGISILILLSTFPGSALAQVDEEEVVRQAAETFLLALSAADAETMDALLAPGAAIYSLRQGEEGAVLGVRDRESFLSGFTGNESRFRERMWDPTVLVQDGVAMVWTPYDFWMEGEFSHCGIDIFTFLKANDGWKVTSITYNVAREGCVPSPLGPPGGGG
jgi:hypothetical protein